MTPEIDLWISKILAFYIPFFVIYLVQKVDWLHEDDTDWRDGFIYVHVKNVLKKRLQKPVKAIRYVLPDHLDIPSGNFSIRTPSSLFFSFRQNFWNRVKCHLPFNFFSVFDFITSVEDLSFKDKIIANVRARLYEIKPGEYFFSD